MNTAAADRIAKAVLYEGYMLYPYRPSAVKNQQRFNFGVVYPQAFSEAQKGVDPHLIQCECLLEGGPQSRLEVRVRSLRLVERSVERALAQTLNPDPSPLEFRPVKTLTIDGQTFHSWQEAVERELQIPGIAVGELMQEPVELPFSWAASSSEELLLDSHEMPAGRIVRTQHAVEGVVDVVVRSVAENVFKIVVRTKNATPFDAFGSRESALIRSLVSAHVVLGVADGEFVSLLDPPEALRSAAADCHNQGVFPVLVGVADERDTMLASPIILYDYPQIAPESAGDLFDGTEIDEILSLRIMTMTDEEKREMRESDERARQMLERTENMPPEQFMKLHGALRGLRQVSEETQ